MPPISLPASCPHFLFLSATYWFQLVLPLWVWGRPLGHGQPSSSHTLKEKCLKLSFSVYFAGLGTEPMAFHMQAQAGLQLVILLPQLPVPPHLADTNQYSGPMDRRYSLFFLFLYPFPFSTVPGRMPDEKSSKASLDLVQGS